MNCRSLSRLLGGTVLALTLATPFTLPAQADEVLRIVLDSDLPSLDPSQTTATVVTDFGHMVFETLFAMDAAGQPQPQMVGAHTLSEDGLVYTFTLRPDLAFHDGAPVTSADVIASLERFFAKDAIGTVLQQRLAKLEAVGDTTFRMTLSEPFGLTLDVLGKYSPIVPYIYPARIIAGGPDAVITEPVGSGPYIYDAAETRPGSVIVLKRNEAYVPRAEPQDVLAGSHAGSVDRVELLTIPDSQTSVNALMAGEIDMISSINPDTLDQLEEDDAITVATRYPAGETILLRFNNLTAPFNDPRARRAFAMVVDQNQYLAVAAARPEYGKVCKSIFTCDSPYTTDIGSEAVGSLDLEAAKALLAESDYDGTPIVVLQPTDRPGLQAYALIAAQELRSIGFNVELAASDWASLLQRRALKGPQAEGGWNLFVTTASADNMVNPFVNLPGNTNCETSWAGWPCDEAANAIRTAFMNATTLEERKKLADDFQARIFEIMPFVPAGQFVHLGAWNKDVGNVIQGPASPFYGLTKSRGE
ncbi:ABC transporter substrate-binding protein [Paracoccus aminophilus]|uniref:Peptide/nickel transport system, substrate-binding protein n=1 Tax=Paracoccus aminophilus JCM 7686 TaxID=1367847 RepID=S5XZF2_PARAH|nr:ABC transporter substrate-binding protein [Paracoccus aminophilus]AGT08830.1 peptide/nickel transport system, substrate-binding protein [Paracoccus aminophilus JCM 7686]